MECQLCFEPLLDELCCMPKCGHVLHIGVKINQNFDY